MPYAKLTHHVYRWKNRNNQWKLLLIFLVITFILGTHGSSIQSTISPRKSLVEFYPHSAMTQASNIYTVKVNGKPVFVEKYNSLSYVQFAFAGQVDIEIKVKEKVEKYTLSPKSYHLQSQHQGKKISFSLTVPRKVILHKVNSLHEKLFIIADPLSEKVPQLGDGKVTNILQYQIDNTGKENVTHKIQTAINEVALRHGVLYFPPGIYKTQQLNLKSNLTLYLAPGAVIVAAKDAVPSYGRGLIYIENAQNVNIMGRGTINGNGSYWRPRTGWYTLILMKNTRNILLQDILLKDPAVANVWMSYSENIKIDNLKIIANPEPEYLNTDGFDFWSSRNITIDNVLYIGTDDATSHGGDRKHWITSNENINVINSVFYNGNGFKIASTEKPNYIKNITYENIDLVFTNELSGFWPVAGGYFENIYFKNIRVEDILDTPDNDKSARLFSWQIRVTPWRADSSIERFGHIRNVFIYNLQADDKGSDKSLFQGYNSQHNISNIIFDNLCIGGKKILNFQDADFNIKNQYVNLKFTSSNPTIVNIKGTDIDASESGNIGQFKITRTGEINKPLTVKYRIRGTADNGKDYKTIAHSVQIPPGKNSVAIAIRPKPDTQDEGLETVLLSLENQPNSTNYMLGPDFQGAVNIRE